MIHSRLTTMQEPAEKTISRRPNRDKVAEQPGTELPWTAKLKILSPLEAYYDAL